MMKNNQHKQRNKLEDTKIKAVTPKASKIQPLFKGRISRSEFAWSYFMFVIVLIVAQVSSPENDLGLLFIVRVVAIIFTASLIVQRLHDLGRPSYHYWLSIIPIYNIYFILSDLCGNRGQVGPNKYGNDPLKNN